MSHERILVVEDEKIAAMEICEHLEQCGYQPLGPCATAEEAIASALSLHPDAILLDITLQGSLDGIQVAEAIATKHPCPIIYVTAHSDDPTLDRAKVTGPFGYILKPIDEREFRIVVEIALYRAKLEKKLSESEERYRVAIEHSNDGVVIIKQGCHAFVNAKFLDMFGYDNADEILGKLVSDAPHLHEDSREAVTEVVRRRLAGEPAPSKYDFRGVHKDGRLLQVEVSATSITYEGEPAALSYLRDITERREAELRLRESEEALKSLLNATHDVACLLDTEGTVITANAVLAGRLGKSSAELVGHPIHSLFPEEVARSRQLRARKVAETGEPARFVDVSLDGRYFDNCIYPVFDADHKVARLAIYGKDITEAKQASEALAESEAKYRDLAELLPQIVFETDETGRITFANRHALTAFGYTEEDISAGLSILECAADKERALVTFRAAMSGAPASYEQTALTKDGKTFPLMVYASHVIRDGNVSGLRGIAVDVSSIRKAEEELRLLKAALEAAANGVVITDRDGRILWVNPAFTTLTGYSAEEAIGQNPRVLKSGKHDDGFYKGMWDTVSAGEVWQGEIINKRKDNRLYTEEMTITPVGGNSGEVTHFIAIKRDVTDRKQAEEELFQTNLQLEQAIERANEMAVQAEAANLAKSLFLANMSHEIRTPLNGVVGMTTLLLDTALTPEQREFAETIQSSSDSLLSVINDILDFSKVEAEKLELETLDFDLRVTAENAVEMSALKAQRKGLELACAIDYDVPSLLRGDPARLRQILINLVDNAIKFTEAGEVEVRVALDHETDVRAAICFTVRDTGIGIPGDRLSALAQPFYQIDASTTRKYGGTGLGLAISKRLVQLMGGRMGIESTTGAGSTFTVTIPFQKQPAAPQVVLAAPMGLRDRRILVVDDNQTNRHIMLQYLQSCGCHARAAGGAEEALATLHEARAAGKPFHIALIDMEMPGMDGATLGRKIKGDPAIDQTILVMLASHGQRGDARSTREIGFAAYLTKPLKRAQLFDCLALALRSGQVAGRQGPPPLITRHVVEEQRRRNVRILVAEDNIINQKVVERMLEKLGLGADVAANGREALKALDAAPYDLVLMDVQMPEMDGFEATAIIRRQERERNSRHIPIIAMTAHALKGDRERCIEAGMDDYVSKPIQPKEFAEAVDRALRSPPSGMEGATNIENSEMSLLFNRPALLQRLGGDKTMARQIMNVFLEIVPDQLEQMRQAIKENNKDIVRYHAHSLKGSAANMEATTIKEIALQIEQNASVTQDVPSLLDQLEAEFSKLQGFLATHESVKGSVDDGSTP